MKSIDKSFLAPISVLVAILTAVAVFWINFSSSAMSMAAL